MTKATDRATQQKAMQLGYWLAKGHYQGTTDDRLGRWYVGYKTEPFKPFGPGYATRREAWESALDHAKMLGRV